MTVLVETRAGDLHNLLPVELDPAGWHARLVAEIATHLSPAHAAILARPRPYGDSTAWEVDAAATRRFSELSAADRRTLTESLGTILSRIRRLAESGVAPAVAACWPALREVPDLTTMVFAADGVPVIAAWGHVVSASHLPWFLARYDDGVPWRPPPRYPWHTYGVAALGLVLLALLAGLLLPLATARVFGSVTQCPMDPDSLAVFSSQSAEAARHADLEAQLAAVLEERGRRQMNCAVPPPPRPQAELRPPPAPQPPPRPALPQEQWRRHELTMLEGCWHRYTNLVTRDIPSGRPNQVRDWTICFDRQGRGQQTIVWSDGARCEGRLQAQFNADDTVYIRDAEQCRGNRGLVRGEWTCRRESESEASCPRTDLEGPNPGINVPGQFRR